MWEICIEANSSNGHLIDYIEERMQPVLAEVGGIKSTIQLGGNKSIALGCRVGESAKVIGVLRPVLCDVVCEKMKFDFLRKQINLLPGDSKFFEAFVKVCTYFDSELERKIVMRSLPVTSKIVLESLLDFRMRPLKNKWQELCNLTNDNSTLFVQSETFVELLKFLIDNLEHKSDCVVLSFDKECAISEERGDKVFLLSNLSADDDIGIITSVIELCPHKIKVFSDNGHIELLKFLCELFEGRVEIISR